MLADNSRKMSEAHQESKRIFDQEAALRDQTISVLRDRLLAVGRCAKEGPTLSITDPAWSPVYSAVEALYKKKRKSK